MVEAWRAPVVSGPLHGAVQVPGSKSITNRALVLAALADAPTRILGALLARDTRLMVAGLRELGADVRAGPAPTELLVEPGPVLGGGTIDCGLAGTVMRFLPPVAALAAAPVGFDGDAHARLRPLGPLAGALRALGAQVSGDALPITVRGPVTGRAATLDASASSQFVSGLLLVAPALPAGLDLRHRGPALPSLPHVDMTVAMLRERGARVSAETDDPTDCRWQVPPGPLVGGTVDIEPDLSNAGPFLAAAMVTGGTVTIPGWPTDTTQAGDRLRGIFAQMGAVSIERTPAGLTLSGPADPASLRGLTADLGECGELVPTVAAVAALASSPSELTGIAHLRGHETDRIAALAAELRRLGAGVVELPDGLRIIPGPLTGATVECYADHRMATFGAIVGLRVPGVSLSDVGATSKTLPDFPLLWQSLIATANA